MYSESSVCDDVLQDMGLENQFVKRTGNGLLLKISIIGMGL